jgi:hypothetical protein
MDKARRKELVEQFQGIKILYGVVQITNERNGKVFLKGYPNLKNKEMSMRSQLDAGRFQNLALQADWREQGGESFTYQVLEEAPADQVADVRFAMQQMETKWLKTLQPYEERGYHRRK